MSRDLLAVLRLRTNAYGDAGRFDSPGATTVGGECDPLPSAARGACASCPPVFPGAAGAAPTASPAYFPLPLPSPLPPPVSSPVFPFDGVGAARHPDLVVGVKARRRPDLQSAVGGGVVGSGVGNGGGAGFGDSCEDGGGDQSGTALCQPYLSLNFRRAIA